jgi:lipopolysaccharide biosynthesis glycosyltransferase
MGRAVLLQANERFEKYLDVALRTWLSHNDRRKWDFYLLDLGLSAASIKKYGKLCHLDRVADDNRWGRFVHAEARLEAMAYLCEQGHTVFQLDADVLSLDSTEPWISEFEKSDAEFSAVSEFPHHLFMQFNSGKPLAALIADYPGLGDASFSTPSWNFGLVMLKGPKAIHLCREAASIMRRHEAALPWAEQSAFNAAFYGESGSCLQMGRIYNYMLNVHQIRVTPDWKAEAIDNPEEKVRLVHYAGHDQKISLHGPYAPHEELWLHWAVHAPLLGDLI